MLKSLLIKTFFKCGGVDVLRRCNSFPRVIFWHGVDQLADPDIESESIRVDVFEQQIQYLARHYEIISMDEFYQRYIDHSFRGSEIVLTFDDGYLNNLTQAAPILKKKSLPFLIFVSTANITDQKLFPTSVARLIAIGTNLRRIDLESIGFHMECGTRSEKKQAAKEIGRSLKIVPLDKVNILTEELQSLVSADELQHLRQKYSSICPMQWDDIPKVREMGGTIGSHCVDHFCCHARQSPEETRRQLFESKAEIEKRTGAPCLYFAYPNGDHTALSDGLVHDAGYRMGFTVGPQKLLLPGEDMASLPRFSMMGDYEKSIFLLNMNLKLRKAMKL